jgi:hypothetical protein
MIRILAYILLALAGLAFKHSHKKRKH